jgi:hypothetical protein
VEQARREAQDALQGAEAIAAASGHVPIASTGMVSLPRATKALLSMAWSKAATG